MFILLAGLLLIPALPAIGEENALRVERAHAVFTEALGNRRLFRETASWYNGFYLDHLPKEVQELYTKDLWATERENWLRESVTAGMDGPFLPWSVYTLGEKTIDRLCREDGMTFPLALHSGAHSTKAMASGAKFILNGVVACWDSAYMDAANAFATAWLEEYYGKPWISYIMGKDEPLNYAACVRVPAVIDRVNAALKREYGIPLTLSPVNPDMPWEEWPNDPAVIGASAHDVALLRIALWRWLNDRIYEAAARERDIVRRFAPGKTYYAYNRNAINIRDVFDGRVNYSIDFLDQARMYDVTDGFSADPYPTYNLQRDGRARAIYHTGFTAKLVTDLGAGKPSKMILQAFGFHGIVPAPADIREWAGQAAKCGTTNLEWYNRGEHPLRHGLNCIPNSFASEGSGKTCPRSTSHRNPMWRSSSATTPAPR